MTVEQIVLYTHPQSRGRSALWMLEEIGAPYRVQRLDFDNGEHEAPEYRALNPLGHVPAIVHRGVVVTASAAICAYLADAFPESGLAPGLTDPLRATYLRWLFFSAGCLEPALVDRMFSRPMPEPPALGFVTYAETLNVLEHAISPGPFILGERFSAADVHVGGAIEWGLRIKNLEPRQAFREYLELLTERPAYDRALAADAPSTPP